MLSLFYRNGDWKDWDPKMVRFVLGLMNKSGQLVEDWSSGKLKGFAGWIRFGEEDIPNMKSHVGWPKRNDGPFIAPIFVAHEGKGLLAMMRKAREREKELRRDAMLQPLKGAYSWRKGHFRRVF
jgi:hypothetical protein